MNRRSKTSNSSSNGVVAYYGLRQNPKKTEKLFFSPLVDQPLPQNTCSFCGDTFTSTRSLSIHRGTHSALLTVSATVKKATAEVLSVSPSSSIKAEQELEEAAVCLMMLSHGTRFWRLLEEDKRWVECQIGERSRKKNPKTEDSVSGKKKKNVESEDSVSGSYFESLCGLEEGDDSTEMVGGDMGLSESDTGSASVGSGSGSNRWRCRTCGKGFDTYQGLGGHMASQRVCNSARDERRPGRNGRHTGLGHMCQICMRVFGSGQALGGHKRAHFVGVREEDRRR